MWNAFQITEADVRTVLDRAFRHLGTFSDDDVEKTFDWIDSDAVEKAALAAGEDMDEQTEAALAEIERQLKEDFSKSRK